MKRSKQRYATCPSCVIEKHRTELRICMSRLVQWERQAHPQLKDWGIDAYGSLLAADFEWACDACLASGRAILAAPAAQVTPWSPHLAYGDTLLQCTSCRADFVFEKSEKRVWYESYKLPTRAQPQECLPCRRAKRVQKAENTRLSDLLRQEEATLTVAELEEVVAIYERWQKPIRAQYFRARLQARLKRGPDSRS